MLIISLNFDFKTALTSGGGRVQIIYFRKSIQHFKNTTVL